MNFVSLYPIECEQTELKNMENPFEEQQNKLQRPTFLLVLCILTFIGSGWGTLSNLFSVFTAGLTDSSMQMGALFFHAEQYGPGGPDLPFFPIF